MRLDGFYLLEIFVACFSGMVMVVSLVRMIYYRHYPEEGGRAATFAVVGFIIFAITFGVIRTGIPMM